MRLTAHAFVLVLSAAAAISALAQPLPRAVLLIDRGPQVRPWSQQWNEAFADSPKTVSPANVHVENLRVDELAADNLHESLRSHFRETYAAKRSAYSFAIARMQCRTHCGCETSWPGTPMISAEVSKRAVELRRLPANAAGITDSHRLRDTVRRTRSFQVCSRS